MTNSKSSKRNFSLGCQRGELYPLTKLPDANPFTDPGVLTVGILVPWKEDIELLMQEHTANPPSSLPEGGRQPSIY